MTDTLLFRLDNARDNDAYLEMARASGEFVYSGLEITFEHGWVPDFVRMTIAEDYSCSLTLIELEGTRSKALIGARKYLPESSEQVLSAFHNYLDRCCQRCRSTADPRFDAIQTLRDNLRQASTVSVWAAAGLRHPPELIETLPFADSGILRTSTSLHPAPEQVQPSGLGGARPLSPRMHKEVSRSILILDAVVRGWDKSDASLRAWRNARSQPLRHEVKAQPVLFPVLCSLLLGEKSGVQLTIDDAAGELSAIWNRFQPGRHSVESIVAAINAFIPFNSRLKPTSPMGSAFERAHEVMKNTACRGKAGAA